jgi:hypothetical protein
MADLVQEIKRLRADLAAARACINAMVGCFAWKSELEYPEHATAIAAARGDTGSPCTSPGELDGMGSNEPGLQDRVCYPAGGKSCKTCRHNQGHPEGTAVCYSPNFEECWGQERIHWQPKSDVCPTCEGVVLGIGVCPACGTGKKETK